MFPFKISKYIGETVKNSYMKYDGSIIRFCSSILKHFMDEPDKQIKYLKFDLQILAKALSIS